MLTSSDVDRLIADTETEILGVIHLLAFPVGTAIGAYTLWALLNDQTKALFA